MRSWRRSAPHTDGALHANEHERPVGYSTRPSPLSASGLTEDAETAAVHSYPCSGTAQCAASMAVSDVAAGAVHSGAISRDRKMVWTCGRGLRGLGLRSSARHRARLLGVLILVITFGADPTAEQRRREAARAVRLGNFDPPAQPADPRVTRLGCAPSRRFSLHLQGPDRNPPGPI